jgi:hypothetical protein
LKLLVTGAWILQGLTLEKMDEMFSKPWLERTNVWYYLRCGGVFELLKRRRKREEREKKQLADSPDQLSSNSSTTISSSGRLSSNSSTATLISDKAREELPMWDIKGQLNTPEQLP